MLKVKLTFAGHLTPTQKSKLERARDLFELAVNSMEFRQAVLSYSYTVSSYTGRLWWKKWKSHKVSGFRECSLSTEQVYASIMSGGETLSPEKDKEADISVTVAAGSRGVIGWTNPHTPMQWISSWFINDSEVYPTEIAGNLSHEWMHKLGFDHAFNYYNGREDTLPYAVGNIIVKLAEQIVAGKKLVPIEGIK
jgi:hypothetical protein